MNLNTKINTMNVQQLTAKKQQIEQARQKLAEVNGQIKAATARLKKEFNVKNISEAAKAIDNMKEALAKLEKTINKKTDQIKEIYLADESEAE